MTNSPIAPQLDRIYSTDTADTDVSYDLNERSNFEPSLNSSDISPVRTDENEFTRNIQPNEHMNSRGSIQLQPPSGPDPDPNLRPQQWLRARWKTCHTFEEAVMTLRPTSAAYLLALMAMCNLGSLFFHSYTALWWLSKGNFAKVAGTCGGDLVCWVSTLLVFGPDGVICNQSLTGQLIWAWLIAQVVIGGLKLCFRFNTKRLCIRFIRNPHNQGHENQEEIGTIMQSISFRVHMGLGRTAQILAWMGHLFYFYLENHHYKINKELPFDDAGKYTSTEILLDVCCANVIISFLRAFVALYVLHYYAFQDQIRLSNPAKVNTGLSQLELYKLMKRIRFTNSTQKTRCTHAMNLKDTQCTICLQSFEDGENLACLPCDGKHVFHEMCIRTWLSKRDSCPLCQHSLRPLSQ